MTIIFFACLLWRHQIAPFNRGGEKREMRAKLTWEGNVIQPTWLPPLSTSVCLTVCLSVPGNCSIVITIGHNPMIPKPEKKCQNIQSYFYGFRTYKNLKLFVGLFPLEFTTLVSFLLNNDDGNHWLSCHAASWWYVRIVSELQNCYLVSALTTHHNQSLIESNKPKFWLTQNMKNMRLFSASLLSCWNLKMST